MPGRTALILSGGGAKGAFQCGAEKYARETKGYQWDIIAGVSVGALNGAMLAMQKYTRLFEIWNTISNDQVYTGGFNLWSVIKLLFGAKSFYGNQPLRNMMQRELEPERTTTDLRVGAVSLVTGEYIQFTPNMPGFFEAVLASTVMPIIWEPIDVPPDFLSMVDGGVRNISPIGDVLGAEPDEIVVINCSQQEPPPWSRAPADIREIGLRTLDILLNELFVGDLREFLRINRLVQEAGDHGVTLHHENGRLLRFFPCKIIEPDEPLGDTLDFSQAAVQRSIAMGVRRAREVLGR